MQVPIYDARTKDNFLKLLTDLNSMPHYIRELPTGSVAIVAYTVNTWGGPLVNVSFNIKWVMLLGLPDA